MQCTECGHTQGVEFLETCDNCNSSAWFVDFLNPDSVSRFWGGELVIRCRSCGDYFDSVLCGKCENWISGREGFLGNMQSETPNFVPPCTECGETIGGPWLSQPCLHCGKTSSAPNEEEADLRRRLWGKDGIRTEDERSHLKVFIDILVKVVLPCFVLALLFFLLLLLLGIDPLQF